MDDVARASAVRALAIKGPVLSLYGLRRNNYQSYDVDVLVEPGRLIHLLHLLEGRGWATFSTSRPDSRSDLFGVTLQHRLWPVDIDLHGSFPGMLASAGDAFAALWEERSVVTYAHREVRCTGTVGSATIAALHYARHPDTRRHEMADLVERVRSRFSERELADLWAMAASTGARPPLGQFFADLHLVPSPSGGVEEGVSLSRWQLRVSANELAGTGWVLDFAAAPPVRWPLVVMRKLFLRRDELRMRNPNLKGTISLSTVGHWRYWRQGFRAFPAGVRLLALHLRQRRVRGRWSRDP